MWKIALGFIVFAGIALFMINKSGGDIDMSGEKHGADAHPPAATTPATPPAAPASGASGS